MRKSVFFALPALAAVLTAAETVDPSAYSMPNGEQGPGGLLYRDDLYKGGNGDPKQDGAPLSGGLGQLADGAIGCSGDPASDCGSGAGYDWIGWHRRDPIVVFTFGERCEFRTVRIYAANRPDEGAPLWKTVAVSISDDGLNFRDEEIRTTTAQDRADHRARFIDVPVRGSGKFVRVHVIRDRPNDWTLIAEVRFEGRISRDQAPRIRPK